MTPYETCRKNTKEMKELLLTHPNNKHLLRWVRRQEKAVKEQKSSHCRQTFNRLWAACPRTRGVKKELAYGEFLKFGEEVHEQIIMAAGEWAKDCKKDGTEEKYILHLDRWLREKVWQTYKASVEKVKKAKSCQLCGGDGNKNLISLMVEKPTGKYKAVFRVCDKCKQYEGKDYDEVKNG